MDTLLQPVLFNRDATLTYFIKPITQANNLLAGAVGSRKIASYLGVKDGDPFAAYVLKDHIIASRPTTAQIDAGDIAPFGSPTVSKTSWALNDYWIRPRIHSEILSDLIGDNTENLDNSPNGIGQNILGNLAAKMQPVIVKDALNHAFWSHTAFDPDTTYDGTHTFPSDTVTSYAKDNGFMKLLKAANTAGSFTNYKTTSGTGGIDVDGATLSTANAYALARKMIDNANRKLRGFNEGSPISERPFLLLSHDFYYVLRQYVATTYAGVDAGYLIFADGTDGRARSESGFMLDGFAVYNAHAVLDEYWETTNPASKYNHMGIMTTPENFGIGFNFRSPNAVGNGNTGLRLYPRPEPEMGGAIDLYLYLQMDYQIADTTLFSTVGIEQAP